MKRAAAASCRSAAELDYGNHPDDNVPEADPIPEILQAVSELYESYHRNGGDVTTNRMVIESNLGRLMAAWNRMLG